MNQNRCRASLALRRVVAVVGCTPVGRRLDRPRTRLGLGRKSMPAHNHVENPFEYVIEGASRSVSDIRRAFQAPMSRHAAAPPAIGRIGMADIRAALREGLRDLGVARTDVWFIALIYPLAGLVLARLAFSMNFLP